MSLNIISFLTTIQTLYCVHKNNFTLSRKQRILRGFILILDIVLTCISTLVHVHYCLLEREYRELIHYILSLLNSASVIISVLCYSESFQLLFECIEKNHGRFSVDYIYVKNINQIIKKARFLSVFTIFSPLPEVIQIFLNVYNIEYFIVIDTYVLMMYNIRFLMAHVLLFTLLNILSEQVNFLTRIISKERGIPSSAISEDILSVEQEVTSFDEWTVIYTNIKNCSNLINCVFGLQVCQMYSFVLF